MRTRQASLDAEWWWVAARIDMMLDQDNARRQQNNEPLIRWQTTPTTIGVAFEGSIGNAPLLLVVAGGEGTTTIHTIEGRAGRSFWKPIYDDVTALAHKAYSLRRAVLGRTFVEILVDYYQRKERGERVKLKALADEAGVNYDSLRQAKFRYDAKRRKM